ncbi:hypothetical protein SS50377_25826 [Spironucleus salmonicida]|uniref:Uncharacterized protein n=1 Tax=Spironucleus salmonicida TaxID=348837 RepID=V6LLA2_9EUKA|nr:hypothetical protein SS50377_25826 [Spironucleus salmonicida]|eukprot:EST45415.1 Hypothetical protein SS50377_14647 [Spironucleus salmonicida]
MELKYRYKVQLTARPMGITAKKFDITYCDAGQIIPKIPVYEQLKFIKGPFSAYKPPPPYMQLRTPADDQAIIDLEAKCRDKSSGFAKERGYVQLLSGLKSVFQETYNMGVPSSPIAQSRVMSRSSPKRISLNTTNLLNTATNRVFSHKVSPAKVIKGRPKWGRDVTLIDSDWAGGKNKEHRV